jgi:hypothetical protein
MPLTGILQSLGINPNQEEKKPSQPNSASIGSDLLGNFKQADVDLGKWEPQNHSPEYKKEPLQPKAPQFNEPKYSIQPWSPPPVERREPQPVQPIRNVVPSQPVVDPGFGRIDQPTVLPTGLTHNQLPPKEPVRNTQQPFDPYSPNGYMDWIRREQDPYQGGGLHRFSNLKKRFPNSSVNV